MIAAEVMIKEVVTVRKDATVVEALKTLCASNIRQMPVVDAEGRVVGLLTPRRILHLALPKYITDGLLKNVGFAPDVPKFLDSFKKISSKTVEELMEKGFVKVSPETSSMEVATIFVTAEKQVDCALVVDDRDVLLGIITPEDIVFKLCEYAGK